MVENKIKINSMPCVCMHACMHWLLSWPGVLAVISKEMAIGFRCLDPFELERGQATVLKARGCIEVGLFPTDTVSLTDPVTIRYSLTSLKMSIGKCVWGGENKQQNCIKCTNSKDLTIIYVCVCSQGSLTGHSTQVASSWGQLLIPVWRDWRILPRRISMMLMKGKRW